MANVEFVTDQARSGALTLKARWPDGSERALHSLYDPEAEARDMTADFVFERGMLVVLGMGLGYHIRALEERFPSARIIVIERFAGVAEIVKQAGVMPDVIEAIVGASADEALSAIARIQLREGMPPVALFVHPPSTQIDTDYYRPLVASLENTVSLRLSDRLRYPKFCSTRLCIAILDSGYFLVREVAEALSRLGHRVLRVRVEGKEGSDALFGLIMRTVMEQRPDFFLTINHLGFDEAGELASFFSSIEMPVASWYVDSPSLIVGEYARNVTPFVSLFLWDRSYMDRMRDAGFESLHYLPLGTDERVFQPISPSAKNRRRYGARLGFVGNSMVEPTEKKLRDVPPELKGLIEETAQRVAGMRAGATDAVRLVAGAIEGIGVRERIAFESAVLWRATMIYRAGCLRELAPFGPAINGDSGWRTLLGGAFDLRGGVDYYRELPMVYNSTAINFNATNLQMGQAVNQRVFDVPACSAFMLTDYQESLEDLFDIGREVIVYRDRAEIAPLVRHYLDNEAERQRVGALGRERVLREHTYVHRLTSLTAWMKERYA